MRLLTMEAVFRHLFIKRWTHFLRVVVIACCMIPCISGHVAIALQNLDEQIARRGTT